MLVSLLIRLSRSIPLIIVLVLLAIVAYFVLQFKYSPPRAKAILARLFTWITGALSILFAIACLYALIEDNIPVLELFAAFLLVSVIGLIITRICRAVLIKHHPEYKKSARRTTGTGFFPWLKGKR